MDGWMDGQTDGRMDGLGRLLLQVLVLCCVNGSKKP